MRNSAYSSKRVRIALAIACVTVASALLCGCLGLSQNSTPAAVVDGTVILESDVTSYIEGFRKEDDDRKTDKGWSEWLSSNSFTPESLRTYVINNVFIPKAVVRNQAKALSLEVTQDELDKLIEKEKTYYVERSGAESWSSVLASYGYDEAKWRSNEEDRLLEERLKNSVVDKVTPTESQVKTYGVDFAQNYNGKHSYFIAFDSEELAQEALTKLGGEGARVQLSEFKKLGKRYAKLAKHAALQEEDNAAEDADADSGEDTSTTSLFDYVQTDGMVDAGWGSLSNSVGSSNSVYANALNELGVGDVSPVVDMENDTYVLIFCDASYVANIEDDVLSLTQVPEAILKQITRDVADDLEQKQFEKWLDEATEKSSVTVYDMPSGLSYDVNASIK